MRRPILRNRVNAAVDKAKSEFVKNMLVTSKSNPKKFWRNIKGLIDSDVDIVDTVIFKDPITGDAVSNDMKCNFVNRFFAEIEQRVCRNEDARMFIPARKVESEFHFMPPDLCDIMIFSESIDVCTSSGIFGLNMKLCKTIIQHIPEKFRLLFSNSMFSGIFPSEWATSNVKLLPKSGDMSNPGSWRPISLTNVFPENLRKISSKTCVKIPS